MNHNAHQHEDAIIPVTGRRGVVRWLAASLACLLLFAGGTVNAQETWLFSPYQVNVWISYGPSVRVTSVQRAELRRVLRSRVDTWAKSMWNLKIPAVPPQLRSDVAHHPWEITYREIAAVVAGEEAGDGEKTPARKEPTVLDADKLYVVSVTDSGTELRVRARELDCRALSWSRPSERRLQYPGQLGDAVFSAIEETFSPVVRFREFRTIGYQNEAGQEKSREVLVGTLRAAGLMYKPRPEPVTEEAEKNTDEENAEQQPAAVAGQEEKQPEGSIGITPTLTDQFELDRQLPGFVGKGMVMRAVVRRDDRYGNPLEGGITEVVATYLFVQKVHPTGTIECKVYATGSLAKNPVRARASSRTHKYGLLVKPTADKTDLKLVDRDQPGRGLEGYTVFSKTPQFPSEENFHAEEGDPRTLGQTDWRGIMEVDRLSTQIRIIYVRNGQQMLARIPVVPGLDDVQVAPLPSDDLRLQVEAFIVGFQLAVMDVVIQRQVLAFRVRAKLKEKKLAEAQRIYNQFMLLPSKSDLEKRLLDRQRDFTGGAIDKFSRAKIDALFSRTRLLMDNYIDLNLDAALTQEVPQTATGVKAGS